MELAIMKRKKNIWLNNILRPVINQPPTGSRRILTNTDAIEGLRAIDILSIGI
jgi:hypothetical protein